MNEMLFRWAGALAIALLAGSAPQSGAQAAPASPPASSDSATGAAAAPGSTPAVPSAQTGTPPSAAGQTPAAGEPQPTQQTTPGQPQPTQQITPGQPQPTQQTQPGLSQRPGEAGQPGFTLPVFVRRVNLVFTVTDSHGQFVNGLQQQNFGLLDDGRPPERVVSFQQQTNLPLRVGLMLDTSSSIRQRFEFEQEAATDFLLQVLHPADRAFVEGFDVQTNISQDFTNRVDLLDTGIRKLRPGGGTALFDSLYKTCRDQMLTLQNQTDVRKAIVLVSDGDDDYSRVMESEAIKMCQRAQTIVYAISTNYGPSRDKGDDVLLRLSDATGGQTFFPRQMTDVSIGFHSIEEALRSQYSLVYVPPDFKQDGAFRTIYLHALDPRYAVRVEKGYFAPRAPQ